ncbi:hypothetical protein [Streptomyces sp. NPDC002082]|uniref:hypothetical protein n=1 Tax=Streptomyces sp. NPDC002082 TaxID=3154772 RepID=UPI003319D38D
MSNVFESPLTPEPTKLDPPMDPYAQAAKTIRKVALWLIGALTAVASVIVAGTQLTTLGGLDFGSIRLWFALAMIGVALTATGYAIRVCVLLQLPGLASAETVREEAGKAGSDFPAEVAKQELLPEGTTLPGIVDSYQSWRKKKNAAAKTLRAQPNDAAANNDLDEAERELQDIRPVVNRLQYMAGYFNLRREFKEQQMKLLIAASVAGIAFAFFAWAANPQDEKGKDAAEPAVPSEPVAARLHLNRDGQERLGATLGKKCAAAAGETEIGIPVIALDSDKEGVDVVIQDEGTCKAVRVKVPTSLGRVQSREFVKLPTATGQ